MSWPSQANSSGIQLSPTPSSIRPGNMAAAEPTVFAISSGWRSANLVTLVPSMRRSVEAAMAGIATHGSTQSASEGQKRWPSAL